MKKVKEIVTSNRKKATRKRDSTEPSRYAGASLDRWDRTVAKKEKNDDNKRD